MSRKDTNDKCFCEIICNFVETIIVMNIPGIKLTLILAMLLFTPFGMGSLKADNKKVEAESGKMVSCSVVSDTKYSGKKAVRMTEDAARLTLSVEVSKRQKHKIFVAADGIGGQKDIRCSINGAAAIFKANVYAEVEVGTFILNEGSNEIVITPSWTWFNVDYVRIEADGGNDIAFDIAPSPVTADATPAAKALYGFLKENFGKRTISGMMTGSMDGSNGTNIKTHEDILAVYKASGRYPALVGFDFMNSTGASIDRNDAWMKNYSTKVISLAKDTWRRGGIPDFTWHWRDPSRQTEEFYTDKVKFKFTSAMNSDGSWNTSSALYKNIIKDIDIVADAFLSLQKAGMACIFRPLHEATGGWFWWGSQGADAYKKLYRLIYDEMVNVKGVRNVIWDWNADCNVGDKWCPGDLYYDVVSTDIYNNKFDYSSNYPSFDKLKAMTGGKKIIALAENGPIPDIELQEADEAMWSWWMPWYQSWNGGFVDQTAAAQWKKCMTDDRVITLEDMPGWDAYTSLRAISEEKPAPSGIFNLQGQKFSLGTKLPAGIYIINGKKVRILPR